MNTPQHSAIPTDPAARARAALVRSLKQARAHLSAADVATYPAATDDTVAIRNAIVRAYDETREALALLGEFDPPDACPGPPNEILAAAADGRLAELRDEMDYRENSG